MSTVRNAINSISGQDDKAKQAKEVLQLLDELASEKAASFQTEIAQSIRTAGTEENKTIPISALLLSHDEIRVTTSDTTNDTIMKTIGESLKNILVGSKDGIINGLTNIINMGLSVVLGCGEGEERKDSYYYVSTEGLSIVRLDLIYWCRNITASGITTYAEKSVVCSMKKSSVDLSKVDFNTFLSVYNNQLSQSSMTEEDILAEIENAKKIYKELTNNEDINKTGLISDLAPTGKIASVCNKVSGVWPSR